MAPIKVAVFLSGIVGCRAVLVKSEPDVVGFYEKLGFRKTSETDADLADMYLDIKPMAGTAARDGPDLSGCSEYAPGTGSRWAC